MCVLLARHMTINQHKRSMNTADVLLGFVWEFVWAKLLEIPGLGYRSMCLDLD